MEVRTIRWQCSGCDHLCVLLTDTTVKPDIIVRCPYTKDEWRIVTKKGGGQ